MQYLCTDVEEIFIYKYIAAEVDHYQVMNSLNIFHNNKNKECVTTWKI